MKKSILLVLPLLTACASTPDVVSRLNPFKIDIRQGNYLTQEMVAQLKPGQTKDQVRFILGTPLVTDVFHANRWDYIYRLAKGNGEVQQRHLAVFFEDGKLVRVAGDVVARGPGAAAEEAAPANNVIEITADTPDKKTTEAKKAETKTADAKADGVSVEKVPEPAAVSTTTK